MGSDYEFEQFVRTTEPGLRRALTGHLAREAVADALAEAFAYAWEHWDRVMHLEHPTGYLFRVAQSKVRIRKQGFLPWSSPDATPVPMMANPMRDMIVFTSAKSRLMRPGTRMRSEMP